MMIAGIVLIGFGTLVLLLAALGLFVLHDPLSRQHAATKAGALGVVGIVVGAALIGGSVDWFARALAISAIVWLTMPVASHVLARAAVRSSDLPEKGNDPAN